MNKQNEINIEVHLPSGQPATLLVKPGSDTVGVMSGAGLQYESITALPNYLAAAVAKAISEQST